MSNANRRAFSPIFAAILCLLVTAGRAGAQEQSKDQQACITKMNTAFAKVAKAQGKEALSCIKNFQKGKLGSQTIEACLVADAKGQVSKAGAQTMATQTKSCSAQVPDFAFTSAANLNQQAIDASIDWMHGMFGDDLDAVVKTEAEDKDAARCQAGVAKIAARCFDTYLKEFNKCKKGVLKGKSAAAADSIDDIQACDGADPQLRVSKACAEKMTSTELKKCTGQTISTLFTGCPGSLAACTSGEVETRASEAVTLADNLLGVPEACGNGILESAEECDDGNTSSGDGCSSACEAEYECGNGVVEGTEACDDGNTVGGDGCSETCEIEPAFCGDGVVDGGEECDDGNADPDDGCHDCSITNPEGVAELEGMLFWHNLVRRDVDSPPPAVPLDLLTWNADLQTVAENYADLCIWAHNANRQSDYAALVGGSPTVGENLFISTFPSVSAEDPVDIWAAEEADYDYATNTCSDVCGHYTQIVWDTTTSIGCGYKFCATVAGRPDLDNSHLFVCNYNPAGNWIGERPYDD